MQKLTLAGALCCGVALLALVLFVPVWAQDGGGGVEQAAATIAAATIRAQSTANAQAQSAQATRQAQDAVNAQAQATQQAVSMEATRQTQAALATAQSEAQSAQATANAQSAQATQSALGEIDRQLAATAQAGAIQSTLEAQAATATTQAVYIAATRQAIDASTMATRAVLDARATDTAYQIQAAEIKQRSDFGTFLLYLAGALAMVGVAYVIAVLAVAVARKLTEQPKPVVSAAGDIVIDGEYHTLPMLPPGAPQQPKVNTVNDPRILEAIAAWWDNSEGQDNE